MASPTNRLAACSQFRTPPPDWLWALGGLIISRLCSASCTGFRCGSASCSRSRPCLPVPVRPHSGLPGGLLSTRYRRNVSDNCVLMIHSNARCQPDVQQFRRQDLRICWNQSVEQFAARPETTETVIRPVQAVIEDIFIWIVRPHGTV